MFTTVGRPMKGKVMTGAAGILTVEFLGERHRVGGGSSLEFGRLGDVQIDTNDELPFVAGSFVALGVVWWLENRMTDTDLEIADRGSRSKILIAPRVRVPIGFDEFGVAFRIGRARYELSVEVAPAPPCVEQRGAAPDDGQVWSRSLVALNEEQRLLLTALAEPRLRGRGAGVLPSNADVAERLGWRITKLNRKLDHLCIKFDKLGVPGLRATPGKLATERRRNLVEYCVRAGVITTADLDTLP